MFNCNFFVRVFAALSCATILFMSAIQSMAADYVIDHSSTEKNAGFTLDGDDSIIVKYGTTLSVSDSIALDATGNGNTLTNAGKITTRGKQRSNEIGIHTKGNGNALTNTGVITTDGENAHSLLTEGDKNTLTNTRAITTEGYNSEGLAAIGNENTLSNTGTIMTRGDQADGFSVNGQHNILSNSGSIVTEADGAGGMVVWDESNTLINSGSITVKGTNTSGLSAQGDQNTLFNSGSVVAEGKESRGIRILQDGNTLTNSGSVTVKGADSNAVFVQGNKNILNNNASVVAEAEDSAGFYVEGDENTLSNSGSVTVKGADSNAVFVQGNKNTLNNNASVVAEAEDSAGFYVEGDENTLSNSSEVRAANGHAVRVIGDSNNFTFQAPSFFEGTIDVGNKATLNVISGPSHAILWKIEGTPETVNRSGTVPIFYNPDTQQVATFDTGEMTAANDILGDIVTNVSGLIGSRFIHFEPDHCTPQDNLRSDCGLWISTFGSRGRYDGAAAHADYDSKNYGLALGYDQAIAPELLLGAQLGYGWATSRAETGRYGRAFDNSADGLFASVYGKKWLGRIFIDAALSGGRLAHSARRFVNDNQAPRGQAWGKAQYNSWWLAPEAAIGARVDTRTDWTLTPSAGLRYVLQSLDSTHERGLSSAGNAKVASRNITALESHLELALDRKFALGQLNLRSGWRHRQALGDDKVRVTLVGETKDLHYANKNRDFLYIGADFDFRMGKHITLGLGGEARAGSGVNGFQGRANLRADF